MIKENKVHIREIAREVIKSEAKAVLALADFVDDEFEKVVQLIFESKGRVIISGIGKSAIIAQKIVATLNSTGTPAIFMHAADAIHGDLGMIREEDIVICISKSGNTPEIKVLVPLIKNIGNTNIVAMVSNMDSFLAQNVNYVLNTHVDREACPNNLAPTSSTTAQLVMGDALAICLIQCRQFTSGDFAKYHPGGSLGKRLYTRVADVYSNNIAPRVSQNDKIRNVIVEISTGRLGAVTVVTEENKVLGIITDGDLRRMLEKYDNVDNLLAKDIMSSTPKTIQDNELAYDAFQLMEKNNITQLVVVDTNNIYNGIIHIHDILREGIV